MSFTLRGIAASHGVATGPCLLYDPTPPVITQTHILPDMVQEEKARLQRALEASMQDIVHLRDLVSERVGKEEGAIFEAHLLILEDEALLDTAHLRIEEGLMNAEWAMAGAADEFAQILSELSDSYFQARAADIHDISMRVISHLQGRPLAQLRHLTEPVIIAARDLLPSDTAGLNPAFVLGLVTEQGGPTSHTAILARQMGIPAVVGAINLFATLYEAQASDTNIVQVALNGNDGSVVVDPDSEIVAQYTHALHRYRQQRERLQALRTLPAVTPDGLQIELAANIGRSRDALPAIEAGANGVGLFRTEFLFLDRSSPPDEEEQLAAYSEVLNAFAGKTVIVRTLDIGGDKSIPYLQMPQESNPFLGVRGIRLCLAEPYQHLFRTQLRALLRAAEQSKAALWLMFPMIDDLRELRRAKAFLAETETQLLHEAALHHSVLSQIRVGIMVETPAAALLTDVLAKEADFFSIGTNDLAQYTLASDRMNAALSDLHKPFHPAVMRSIAHIITTARQHNRWVGMCGEMAGDPRACVFLLGLGINELSMEVSSLNAVKQVVRCTTMAQAKGIVQRVLESDTAESVEEILNWFVQSMQVDE